MTDQRYSRYAEKKAGTNNKFYEVKVEEHESGQARLTFTYGRIGTEGRELDQGLYASYGYAVQCADEQFKKKLGKGYTEVTAMQAIASAVETLEERKTNGFEPVDLEIPCFNAGDSEARCRKLCEKWLAKLNLVRGSCFDLGTDYGKQITGVTRGFAREWDRIKNTKAHGHLKGNGMAEEAFFTFLRRLRSNTRRASRSSC